jgi:two-component system, chemotaxis family, sensor kinase CheA
MSKDPYRYFRVEARELVDGLGAGVLELERGVADAELVTRLLRLSHTLKGAARVVKALEIAEASHAIESVLTERKDASGAVGKEDAKALLGHVDRINALLGALTPAAPREAAGTPRAAPDEVFRSVRVEIAEMDALLGAVTATGVELAALREEVSVLQRLAALAASLSDRLTAQGERPGGPKGAREGALARELQTGLEELVRRASSSVERATQELADVREGADRLRLLPAQGLLGPLVRTARDAAEALGKQVSVTMTGGALRLDAHALAPLRDAFVQLVRNAVAHGLETPAERVRAGKPGCGQIVLEVERRGQRVSFRCKDDGRGIDTAAVRRVLVERGSETRASAAGLTEEALLRRLLAGGVTTASATTEHAGRGIGLDVVREVASRLKGKLEVQSKPGVGTAVELDVPISLAAVSALLVSAGGVAAAIPLESVKRTLRVQPADLARSARGDAVAHEGKLIPFVPLARMLRRGDTTGTARAWSAVVVESGQRLAAVGVDRLRGTAEVVVQALPAVVYADPVVAGAALDGAGIPELVLDGEGLVAAAERGHGGVHSAAVRPPPLLVIDDSLTTRMLEQSILESAGYEVEIAVSAEQALEKARLRRYGVFIVDVEMPGMDGFEFVERTRADPELSVTPAILVSSRNDAEDFARGERAGASDYIVKGEFDQGRLLGTIRKLLGGP